MSFRVIVLDGSEEMVSPAMDTKEQALGFAQDLRRDGLKVLRIEDRDGEVVAEAYEIALWCIDKAVEQKKDALAEAKAPSHDDSRLISASERYRPSLARG